MQDGTLGLHLTCHECAKRFFDENGYYLARNVFSAAELAALEEDFDRVVALLHGFNENVNAR